MHALIIVHLQSNDPETVPAHRTFNTICLSIGVNPTKTRDSMDDWVDRHLEWVKQVTEIFLQKKRMLFEQFRLQWLHGSFPLSTPGIMILARAYKIHVAVFFNNNFWTTDSHRGLERCTVFLLYRGSLVFEDSCRMTSEEFAEQKAYFKKLSKYYDKVHNDNDLRRLREHAKRENHSPKNYVPTDDESEDITEVGSVAKDTESEEDAESSSGSSGAEEGDRKTEQTDAVKDIMPTTDDDSGTNVDNDSDESAEKQHVSSTGMAFKHSECAKIQKMQGALNCKQCSQCAKGRESENIMPENKMSSSEELDLENMLNETVEKDTEIEQNKQDETEQNVADKAVSLEEEGQKDIEESVADDDKMDYLVDTDIEKEGNQSETKVADTAVSIEQNEKNKENTHAFLVRPCSVNLK